MSAVQQSPFGKAVCSRLTSGTRRRCHCDVRGLETPHGRCSPGTALSVSAPPHPGAPRAPSPPLRSFPRGPLGGGCRTQQTERSHPDPSAIWPFPHSWSSAGTWRSSQWLLHEHTRVPRESLLDTVVRWRVRTWTARAPLLLCRVPVTHLWAGHATSPAE